MTALVYQFPRHRLIGRDEECDCADPERAPRHCLFCEGGLSFCIVCHGAESSMPTCCPGERMPATVQNAVSAGLVDFDVRSGWIQRSNVDRAPDRLKWGKRT